MITVRIIIILCNHICIYFYNILVIENTSDRYDIGMPIWYNSNYSIIQIPFMTLTYFYYFYVCLYCFIKYTAYFNLFVCVNNLFPVLFRVIILFI